MKTLMLLVTTSMICTSANAGVRNNTFIRPTPHLGTAPSAPPVNTGSTTSAPANLIMRSSSVTTTTIAPTPMMITPAIAQARADYSSEVTSGGTPTMTTDSTGTETTPAPNINNLPNCLRYTTNPRASCWTISRAEKIKEIVKDVKYVNNLHGTYISPRYMLCTGHKESGFTPNITNGENARGMYQVIPITANAAVRSGNPLVPGFSNINDGATYTNKMLKSSAAQVELSLMVLEMKVREGRGRSVSRNGRSVSYSSKIMTSQATDDDYWILAYRYYGTDSTGIIYANRISSCYTCLKKISDTKLSDGSSTSAIETCLAKADGL